MIVDLNLKELIEKYNLVDNKARYDTTCISLTLNRNIKKYDVPDSEIIKYGHDDIEQYVNTINLKNGRGYVLQPGESILACSNEDIRMPNSCFGLLQTKGSLARLFVFISCCDGQVDPGYRGKITFEIYNASNFRIRLLPKQEVANLYIFATSMNTEGYNGKYQDACDPTHSKVE